MIVDCHTHVWQSPDQLGQVDLGYLARSSGQSLPRFGSAGLNLWRSIPAGDSEHHWSQTDAVDKSFVLGFKSQYLRAEIPNRYISDYVKRSPQKLIGFAGIDPTERGAVEELRHARLTLNLRGAVISPSAQDFHPADSRAMRVYAEAERLNMPVIVHCGHPYAPQGKMEYAPPHLLDEVARTFKGLRIVISQVAYPWIPEALCFMQKHANVYADLSGILTHPWQTYNTLVAAHEAGMIDKLLFGSDFPYSTPAECIEGLYSINQMTQGTGLPIVPRECLRGIVERDTLELLGLI